MYWTNRRRSLKKIGMETGRKKCIGAFLILTPVLYLICSVGTAEAPPTFQQGVEYAKLRLYPQAVEVFTALLSQQPTHVNALFQLANVYKLQDELELAIETFNRILNLRHSQEDETKAPQRNAMSIETLHGLTHLALSEIYCKQSQLNIAEQHAKAAVQRCPTDADTYYRLGYIYTHQAKFDEALEAF